MLLLLLLLLFSAPHRTAPRVHKRFCVNNNSPKNLLRRGVGVLKRLDQIRRKILAEFARAQRRRHPCNKARSMPAPHKAI
jgi:hypothetical protein